MSAPTCFFIEDSILYVNTSDSVYNGSYSLLIRGVIKDSDNQYVTKDLEFEYKIQKVTITTSEINDTNYYLGSPQLNIMIDPFIDSSNLIITYTATIEGDSGFPSFISFDSSALTFSIYTIDAVNIVSYMIKVTGTNSMG